MYFFQRSAHNIWCLLTQLSYDCLASFNTNQEWRIRKWFVNSLWVVLLFGEVSSHLLRLLSKIRNGLFEDILWDVDKYVMNHKPGEKTGLQKRKEMGGYLSLLQQYQRTSRGRGAETVLLLSWERHWNRQKRKQNRNNIRKNKTNENKLSEMKAKQ